MGGAFYHHPTFRANHLNWVPSFYQLELGFKSKTQGVIYQSYVYCYFLKALDQKKESLAPVTFPSLVHAFGSLLTSQRKSESDQWLSAAGTRARSETTTLCFSTGARSCVLVCTVPTRSPSVSPLRVLQSLRTVSSWVFPPLFESMSEIKPETGMGFNIVPSKFVRSTSLIDGVTGIALKDLHFLRLWHLPILYKFH